MVIETSSKNSKTMPSEALIELNSFKNSKDTKEINPKKPTKTCACEIFWEKSWWRANKEKKDKAAVISQSKEWIEKLSQSMFLVV